MIGIQVADIVSDPDFTRPITLRRPTRTEVQGMTRTTYVDSSINAIVEPASEFEVLQLPEGSRLRNVLAVYSIVELKADTETQDVIVVDGALYRAIRVEPWPDSGYWLGYFEGFQP